MSKRYIWIVAAVGGLLIAALITMKIFGIGTGINRDGFQLVNLTTGERFIGKLSGTDGQYVILRDVYYQQTTDTQATGSDKAKVESQAQITVAKLSSTVAKPENTMRIASDKIVHWENLQEDSKIVQAIRRGNN